MKKVLLCIQNFAMYIKKEKVLSDTGENDQKCSRVFSTRR